MTKEIGTTINKNARYEKFEEQIQVALPEHPHVFGRGRLDQADWEKTMPYMWELVNSVCGYRIFADSGFGYIAVLDDCDKLHINHQDHVYDRDADVEKWHVLGARYGFDTPRLFIMAG